VGGLAAVKCFNSRIQVLAGDVELLDQDRTGE